MGYVKHMKTLLGPKLTLNTAAYRGTSISDGLFLMSAILVIHKHKGVPGQSENLSLYFVFAKADIVCKNIFLRDTHSPFDPNLEGRIVLWLLVDEVWI